jgi:hypothetical protein
MLVLPGAFGDFDDVPLLVAQAVYSVSGGAGWDTLSEDKKKHKVKLVKRQLNGLVLKFMTPARLTQCDATGDVRGWLAHIAGLTGE